MDQNGTFTVQLEQGSSYTAEIVADGFLKEHEQIDLSATPPDQLELHFVLYPIEKGTTINMKNVHFYRSTADLIETSYEQLDLIAEMMFENPEIEIELAGHTDNQGSFRLNMELSNLRVDAVKDYLVTKGISEKRISGRGYGPTRPIASNATEESRKKNRRVEFTIVKD